MKVDVAQYSNTVEPGSVISTIPPIGATCPVGTVVHIIPSKGVNVPNVVNLAQARRRGPAHATPGSTR